MKKKLLIGLITTLLLSLSACDNSDNDTIASNVNNAESNVKQDISSNEAENNEKDEENIVDKNMPYWIIKQDFSNPQKEFNNLFNENITLPLDWNKINELVNSYSWTPGFEGRQYVDNINEIIASEEYKIQYSGSETVFFEQEIDRSDPNYVAINSFEIFNHNEKDDLTYKECFEKGWWEIFQDGSIGKALLISASSQEELCDKILEKYGSPTYMIPAFGYYEKLDDYYATMELDSVEMYELVYEYPEYCISISITETSYGSSPDVKVNAVIYYTNTMWELKKENKDYFNKAIKIN